MGITFRKLGFVKICALPKFHTILCACELPLSNIFKSTNSQITENNFSVIADSMWLHLYSPTVQVTTVDHLPTSI